MTEILSFLLQKVVFRSQPNSCQTRKNVKIGRFWTKPRENGRKPLILVGNQYCGGTFSHFGGVFCPGGGPDPFLGVRDSHEGLIFDHRVKISIFYTFCHVLTASGQDKREFILVAYQSDKRTVSCQENVSKRTFLTRLREKEEGENLLTMTFHVMRTGF